VLEHRAYLDGTRYYETAECFLFFATRFLREVRDEALHARLVELLHERVLERAGCPGDALALAMRVLVGAVVGLRMERDLAALLPLQCEDGGWGLSWIYRHGSSDVRIGNRGLNTALALNAIAALNPPMPQQEREQEKSLTRERCCVVEITTAPPPQLPVTSVLHGSTLLGLPSPPSLPLAQVRKGTKNGNISVRAFAKGIFAFFCPRNGSPLI
jgi:hypothetical protein